MNCEQTKDEFSGIEGPEGFAEVPSEAWQHLGGCANCQRWLKAFLKVNRQLARVREAAASHAVEAPEALPLRQHADPLLNSHSPGVLNLEAVDHAYEPSPEGIFMRQSSDSKLPVLTPEIVDSRKLSAVSRIQIQGHGSRPPRFPWLRVAAGVSGIALVAMFGFMFFSHRTAEHESLTTQAWNAYKAENYPEAIRLASKCIDEYEGQAGRMQKELARRGASVPVGKVAAGPEREAVFKNGVLNDVATCLYVRGRSLEKTGKSSLAIRDFQRCTELTYARCWDKDQEIFWTPAENANDRLQASSEPNSQKD